MDVIIIGKGEDGTVMAQELGDIEEMGELSRIETQLAETLAAEDIGYLPLPWNRALSLAC